MVTQHDIDRASGAEDPIVFVQRVGQRYALCACRRAVWISDLGFLVLADPAP